MNSLLLDYYGGGCNDDFDIMDFYFHPSTWPNPNYDLSYLRGFALRSSRLFFIEHINFVFFREGTICIWLNS